jgi:hypothetical protein
MFKDESGRLSPVPSVEMLRAAMRKDKGSGLDKRQLKL